ncbi:MAG: hypothetical protein GTO45_39800 [Candidatus Aminicenantes bacterium]|nr:hypothetical protein [Candidatus Aminicenantes bacterium]NIM83293.1 hypothetical protein [Candidatus Aminicenantes bacterium]NIN24264.1 hypothetical protein [Candidatus Aminicenantes bacterium]NIN48025.1 hypothetical protein [Candidatus Aminicenantes bacterium]NIN90927.1 hypothetical protein [Candidatus Aminicenantes bacterium]
MRPSKQQTMAKFTLGVLFFILLNFHSFSWWSVNGTDRGFDGENIIQNYIVHGAGYFLDSYANTLLFMKKTELSGCQGTSYEELGKLLDNALESMKMAIETYTNLKQAADHTPYNPIVIDALKSYNYTSLQETSGLDAAVFSVVKMYLVNGDIRGVYGKMLSDTNKILSLLTTVKASIDEGRFPELTDVWNLNQAFSRTLLFGQYVAQVFNDLLKNNL